MGVYKKPLYPYRDLTGEVIGGYKVIEKTCPGHIPETLNDTKWSCECLKCGTLRSSSGRLLYLNTPRECSVCNPDVFCQSKKTPEDEFSVGEGLMYLQEFDKDRFMAYLEKKKIEVEIGRTGVSKRLIGNEESL